MRWPNNPVAFVRLVLFNGAFVSMRLVASQKPHPKWMGWWIILLALLPFGRVMGLPILGLANATLTGLFFVVMRFFMLRFEPLLRKDEKKMKTFFEILLPAKIDNIIRGTKIPFYIFAIYALVSAARSCIHLLSADGGAGTIAGMDLSVAGADGIIFAFALWGSSQLLFAIIQLLVVLRYRSLVPFMWLMLALEVLLRELVGKMKPITFAHTPPGAIGNQIMLPLAVLMLGLSLWSAYTSTGKVRR